jgi:hypothetical protein
MGALDPPTLELLRRKNGFSPEERADLDAPEVWPEVDALLEKTHQLTKTNERLRKLVTQLSVLIIRDVVDRENRKLVVDTIERARS